jgi:hypothetical protein
VERQSLGAKEAPCRVCVLAGGGGALSLPLALDLTGVSVPTVSIHPEAAQSLS